jgi:hypothetical protein
MSDINPRAAIGHNPNYRIALAGLWIFALSSAFPILASVVPTPLPSWIGWLDVLFATALFVCSAIVDRNARRNIDERCIRASYRAYRVLIHVPIALLTGFFVFGNRVNWPVLLVGIAWRLWLLSYVLPSGIAALSRRTPT